MAFIEWNDSYKLGVWEIDTQHERWFALTNELHDAMLAGRGSRLIGTMLTAMLDYGHTHFVDEERLMVQHGYPKFAEHKAIHDSFFITLHALEQKRKRRHLPITLEVMDTMRNWLLNHIAGSDREFGVFLKKKGVV